MLASACPGWICYAEKTHPDLLPFISVVKSPQQVMGYLAKSYLAEQLGLTPADIYHVTIMPCYDKKLEASRSDFYNDIYKTRDVDSVITSGELERLLAHHSLSIIDLAESDLPETFTKAKRDSNGNWELLGTEGTTSGGYNSFIFRYAAKELFGVDLTVEDVLNGTNGVSLQPGKNSDYFEIVFEKDGKELLRFAVANGFRNIQNLVRKIKPANGKSQKVVRARKTAAPACQFIEVMACPSGCINGGGQLRVEAADGTSAGITSSLKELTQRAETLYKSVGSGEGGGLQYPGENSEVLEIYRSVFLTGLMDGGPEWSSDSSSNYVADSDDESSISWGINNDALSSSRVKKIESTKDDFVVPPAQKATMNDVKQNAHVKNGITVVPSTSTADVKPSKPLSSTSVTIGAIDPPKQDGGTPQNLPSSTTQKASSTGPKQQDATNLKTLSTSKDSSSIASADLKNSAQVPPSSTGLDAKDKGTNAPASSTITPSPPLRSVESSVNEPENPSLTPAPPSAAYKPSMFRPNFRKYVEPTQNVPQDKAIIDSHQSHTDASAYTKKPDQNGGQTVLQQSEKSDRNDTSLGEPVLSASNVPTASSSINSTSVKPLPADSISTDGKSQTPAVKGLERILMQSEVVKIEAQENGAVGAKEGNSGLDANKLDGGLTAEREGFNRKETPKPEIKPDHVDQGTQNISKVGSIAIPLSSSSNTDQVQKPGQSPAMPKTGAAKLPLTQLDTTTDSKATAATQGAPANTNPAGNGNAPLTALTGPSDFISSKMKAAMSQNTTESLKSQTPAKPINSAVIEKSQNSQAMIRSDPKQAADGSTPITVDGRILNSAKAVETGGATVTSEAKNQGLVAKLTLDVTNLTPAKIPTPSTPNQPSSANANEGTPESPFPVILASTSKDIATAETKLVTPESAFPVIDSGLRSRNESARMNEGVEESYLRDEPEEEATYGDEPEDYDYADEVFDDVETNDEGEEEEKDQHGVDVEDGLEVEDEQRGSSSPKKEDGTATGVKDQSTGETRRGPSMKSQPDTQRSPSTDHEEYAVHSRTSSTNAPTAKVPIIAKAHSHNSSNTAKLYRDDLDAATNVPHVDYWNDFEVESTAPSNATGSHTGRFSRGSQSKNKSHKEEAKDNRPPWRPNSLIIKTGFEQEAKYSQKERAQRMKSYIPPPMPVKVPSYATRSLSPSAPKPQWGAAAPKSPKPQKPSTLLPKNRDRAERTRSLAAKKQKRKEVKTRGLFGSMAKKAESAAEKVRNEMKAQGRRRGTKFVSSYRLPAWAPPLIFPPLPPAHDPPPKKRGPRVRTRALATPDGKLTDLLKSMTEIVEKFGPCPELIQKLLEISKFWAQQGETREALRMAVLAKVTVEQILKNKEAEIFQNLSRVEDHSFHSPQKAMPVIPDAEDGPFHSGVLDATLKMEAYIDALITELTDARVREVWDRAKEIPFDEGDLVLTDVVKEPEESNNADTPEEASDTPDIKSGNEINAKPMNEIGTRGLRKREGPRKTEEQKADGAGRREDAIQPQKQEDATSRASRPASVEAGPSANIPHEERFDSRTPSSRVSAFAVTDVASSESRSRVLRESMNEIHSTHSGGNTSTGLNSPAERSSTHGFAHRSNSKDLAHDDRPLDTKGLNLAADRSSAHDLARTNEPKEAPPDHRLLDLDKKHAEGHNSPAERSTADDYARANDLKEASHDDRPFGSHKRRSEGLNSPAERSIADDFAPTNDPKESTNDRRPLDSDKRRAKSLNSPAERSTAHDFALANDRKETTHEDRLLDSDNRRTEGLNSPAGRSSAHDFPRTNDPKESTHDDRPSDSASFGHGKIQMSELKQTPTLSRRASSTADRDRAGGETQETSVASRVLVENDDKGNREVKQTLPPLERGIFSRRGSFVDDRPPAKLKSESRESLPTLERLNAATGCTQSLENSDDDWDPPSRGTEEDPDSNAVDDFWF
ncbi:hypothetical protein HDU96_003242 [Phlyctochytrium bullatum]|nr:hypothetical protein HDU96_003242 [Phlyctochytrium bullatum]